MGGPQGEQSSNFANRTGLCMFKESAKSKPKDKENYTPNNMNFSKHSENHHRFSWNDLSESQIDVSQVSRGSYAAAGLSGATPDSAGTIDAFVLRTRKRTTEKMVDLQTALRMKKRAGLVYTALVERKPMYVSIIKDMYNPDKLSHDYFANCMEQAEQNLNQ